MLRVLTRDLGPLRPILWGLNKIFINKQSHPISRVLGLDETLHFPERSLKRKDKEIKK